MIFDPNKIRSVVLNRIRASIVDHADGLYRKSQSRWVGGEHNVTVGIGMPTCKGGTTNVWHKKHKWSGTNSFHSFTVRADWLVKVEAAGIAVIDHMLCLSAERIHDTGYDDVWQVLMAKQGRGCNIVPVRGYIVRCAGDTQFGETMAQARMRCIRPVARSMGVAV